MLTDFYFVRIIGLICNSRFQQNICMGDILGLAVKEFNTVQRIYQSELVLIQRCADIFYINL